MVFLQSTGEPTIKENAHIKPDIYPNRAVYGSNYSRNPIPRYSMPEDEMPPSTAYQFIKDELALDGNPILNLATFVTTYMEPEADKLIAENISKNFIDAEEYPMSAELQNRCVNMIARLFNAPVGKGANALGVSTIGSSEAIMLSTLAMKRRWQQRRKAEGKSTDKPNLVMGANVQVCWEKAVRYMEIEARYVNCDEEHLFLNPEKAIGLVDENTIGVCAILGSTYTGHYEDAEKMNELLLKLKKEKGLDVPMHIDAASGGFVAPFVAEDLKWDFRLETVVSINVSGHKYGLCYAGIGWALWRSPEYLPDDLVFHINYLGADQASFTLNFSKGASPVISQYYVLIRQGKAGFRAIMENLYINTNYLADELEATGRFKILSARDPKKGLPLVAFSLKKNGGHHFNETDISHVLRQRGWIIPAYTMAPDAQKISLLRVVLREDFSRNRCDLLVADLKATVEYLDKQDKQWIQNHRDSRGQWHSLFKKLPKHVVENKAEKDSGKVC
ncbi:glutamate decarboxylase [Fimicolochytrium jonesii]|uniref:glutamate decarboxylase n=1 Tax=Fimicolochytrium jonesii TaxID=1396493 RepID=UPI0022FDCB5B|nr:glutamate decarboxylase [Fimicolochytrium jonesii]KAI8816846.1 glutamate decarboxylase [Fimicolochytrium jonesii]